MCRIRKNISFIVFVRLEIIKGTDIGFFQIIFDHGNLNSYENSKNRLMLDYAMILCFEFLFYSFFLLFTILRLKVMGETIATSSDLRDIAHN